VVLNELTLLLSQGNRPLDKVQGHSTLSDVHWSLVYREASDAETYFVGPFGSQVRAGVFAEEFGECAEKNHLVHIAILLQGTRHSDVSVMAKELDVIAGQLSAGKLDGAEHDDDYGWAFRFSPKTP